MEDGQYPQDPPSVDEESPEGMELTIPSDDARYNQTSVVPETVTDEGATDEGNSYQYYATQQQTEESMNDSYPFRAQFDDMMSLLGKRFENERRQLEGQHAQELEDALNMLSFTSSERDNKRQEMQVALLDDIGDMAQQLHDLTGLLGSVPEEGQYNDPAAATQEAAPKAASRAVPEEYLQQMRRLEEQFQLEKLDMERKHATEMEEALGALKISRQQRESKQAELQDNLLEEIKLMAQQLEELNNAKMAYESKMDALRRRLHDRKGSMDRDPRQQDLLSMEAKLRHVQREADAAQEELHRLQLALQVSNGEVASVTGEDARSLGGAERMFSGSIHVPPERRKVEHISTRLEEVERDVRESARKLGGKNAMKNLRERLDFIEEDLTKTERSTKEHYLVHDLRTRMEKVEKLLTEAEQAANDWETLEELRTRLGNIDKEIKAAEDIEKEQKALNKLQGRMKEVEAELSEAERVAAGHDDMQSLRGKLEQIDTEIQSVGKQGSEMSSIDRLLARLDRAEQALNEARESTTRGDGLDGSSIQERTRSRKLGPKTEMDRELQSLLRRLDEAEEQIRTAKASARARGNSSYDQQQFSVPLSDERRQAALPKQISPPRQPRDYGDRAKELAYLHSKRHQTAASIDEEGKTSTYSSRSLRRRRLREAQGLDAASVTSSEEKKSEDRGRGSPDPPKHSFRHAIRPEQKKSPYDLKTSIKRPVDSKAIQSPDPPSFRASGPTMMQRGKMEEPKRDPEETGSRASPVTPGRSISDPPDTKAEVPATGEWWQTPVRLSTETILTDEGSFGQPKIPATVKDESPPANRVLALPPKAKSVPEVVEEEWGEEEEADEEFEDEQAGDAPSQDESGDEFDDEEKVSVRPAALSPLTKKKQPSKASVFAAGATPHVPADGQRTQEQGRVYPDERDVEIRNERRDKERLLRWVILILLLIAVVLAIVIIVVVFILRPWSSGDRAGPTPAPTPIPLGPTTAPRPTLGPGFPTTSSPSWDPIPTEPTISPAPSSTNSSTMNPSMLPPSFMEGCPDLDDDRPLPANGDISTRTTENAMYDASGLGTCGTVGEIGGDGVWFVVIGTGRIVDLNTCTIFFPNFNTQLLVYTPFEGQSCMGGLQCVTANDDYCGTQSSVSWFAQNGVPYYVYVNGKDSNPPTGNPTESSFSLTFAQTPEGSCGGAIGPLDITPQNEKPNVRRDTLMGGTFGIDPCNPRLVSRTGEKWFQVVGNGRWLVASTCHGASTFPARLAIYKGPSCNALGCVTAQDGDCGDGAFITWYSEPEVIYFVLVYTPDYVADVSFGLSIQEAF